MARKANTPLMCHTTKQLTVTMKMSQLAKNQDTLTRYVSCLRRKQAYFCQLFKHMDQL